MGPSTPADGLGTWLDALCDRVQEAVGRDPGARGVAELLDYSDLAGAVQSLLCSTTVGIATGFCVAGPPGRCETDGPPGALALGKALRRLGKGVVYVTDIHCAATLRAAGLSPLLVYEREGVAGVVSWSPSHLVAVERPGRAADGRYYTMRGQDISAFTGGVDQLFVDLPSVGVTTVGVADGGNEVGMGRAHARVTRCMPCGRRVAAVVGAHHLVVAGVSNWGAWGIAAALGAALGSDLLPTVDEAEETLGRLVAAGAIDGVTRLPQRTVDGLPWPVHADVLQRLRELQRSSGDGLTTP